jgi:hypothetical protein
LFIVHMQGVYFFPNFIVRTVWIRRRHIHQRLRKEYSCYVCTIFLLTIFYSVGARGGADGWGTVLPAGMSRVRFPMVSLWFCIDTILPVTLWPWSWLNL